MTEVKRNDKIVWDYNDRRGSCIRAIKRLLERRRSKAWRPDEDGGIIALCKELAKRCVIPRELQAKDVDNKNEPFFWMDVRNVLKWQNVPKTGMDAFTEGELLLLEGGGIALASAKLTNEDVVVEVRKTSGFKFQAAPSEGRGQRAATNAKRKAGAWSRSVNSIVNDLTAYDMGEEEYNSAVDKLRAMAELADKFDASAQLWIDILNKPLASK